VRSNSSGGKKRSGSERQRSACSSNPSDPNSGSANWLVSQGSIYISPISFWAHHCMLQRLRARV